MIARGRVLAIAVASGRVGHVFLDDGAVADLGMSRKASTDQVAAQAYAAQQIEVFRPDLVVTEKLTVKSRKGGKTRIIIDTINSVVDMADVLNADVVRVRVHTNRFEEAADLVTRFPKMRDYLPEVRKPWEAEPKALIYFEALSLVETFFGEGPPTDQ